MARQVDLVGCPCRARVTPHTDASNASAQTHEPCWLDVVWLPPNAVYMQQVDAGETPEAALCRELQEELSIQV